MPRRRKTQSGAPAQEIRSVPGQRYGEGVQQAQMQRAMPAPNRVAMQPQPSAAAPQMQTASSMQAAPPEMTQMPAVAPSVDPVEALRAMPTGLLSQPDERPVTSGMNFGPGRPASIPGAPRLAERPTTRMLQMLYDTTNDPMFARLLERFSR